MVKMAQLLKKHSTLLVCLIFLTVLIWMFILLDKKEIKHEKQSMVMQQFQINHINEDRNPESFNSSKIDSITKLIHAAEVIQRRSTIVLITVINAAHLPFAYSWLCNTIRMDIHKQVLVITTDVISKHKLNSDWPNVQVVSWPGLSSDGDQSYSHAGYVKIGIMRSEILLLLTERNVEMLVFEVDCLWIRNPIPKLSLTKGVDLCVNPVSERPGMVAQGFLYMFPTDKTKLVWRELSKRLAKLGKDLQRLPDDKPISESLNDQIILTELITTKYGDIKVMTLDLNEFPDGKWYSQNAEKRKHSHPYIINNNWIVGNAVKIDRAKRWNHWFINDDLTCNYKVLDNLFSTLNTTKQ